MEQRTGGNEADEADPDEDMRRLSEAPHLGHPAAPDEPQRLKTYFGTVVWKLERTAPNASPTLRADITLPEAKLTVTMVLSRSADPKAVTSHIITLRFTPDSTGAIGEVSEIETPSMRVEDRPVGEALEGKPAPVTPNYFFVGLIRDDVMTSRNLELMKTRAWVDIPMRLTSGRIAKITFEKGQQGERLLADALAAWN